MPCEHYKDALIEAAATGIEPQGELRSHLAACALCRAAFAEERALFSSLDAGLHVAANSEVPASLLPRVRARIAEETTATRSWATTWFALAGAAAMVVAFIAVQTVRRANVEQKLVETTKYSSPPAPLIPPRQSENPIDVPPVSGTSVPQPRVTATKGFASPEALASRNTVPEVLVPRDQEVLVARYAEQWSRRRRAPLLAENSGDTALSPMEVAPIQIAQLDVKLLAEEKAQ